MADLKRQYHPVNSSPILRSARKAGCNFVPPKSLREQIKEKMKETGMDKKILATEHMKDKIFDIGTDKKIKTSALSKSTLTSRGRGGSKPYNFLGPKKVIELDNSLISDNSNPYHSNVNTSKIINHISPIRN